jgi:hypothetical protein
MSHGGLSLQQLVFGHDQLSHVLIGAHSFGLRQRLLSKT